MMIRKNTYMISKNYLIEKVLYMIRKNTHMVPISFLNREQHISKCALSTLFINPIS